MSETTTLIPREMPKWACLAAIIFSLATLGVQGAIDVYQGARNTTFLSPEWMLQAYSMSLPTFGAVVFSLFCGWLFNIQHKILAVVVLVLAASFMAVTTSNGWDFMTAQTIGKSEAQQRAAQVAKEVADVNNEQTLKERNRATDELWRTYTTTNNAERKKEAFDKIREITQAPIALQTAPVDTSSAGSGAIFHNRLGWRPEAVQELRALALPALFMVAKMLGLTLGFGFWPRGSSPNLPPSSAEDEEGEEAPENKGLESRKGKRRRYSEKEAREDLQKLLAAGVHIPSQVYLADKWGVSQVTVNRWLGKWPEAQRVPAENGRRNHIVWAHTNGSNGRLLTQ